MIGRNIREYGSGLLGGLVLLCIEGPHEPVGVGNAEGLRQFAEVFRRGRGGRLEHRLGAEELGERLGDGVIDRFTVVRQRELVEILERRFLRGSGGLAFAADDPLDRCDHPPSHRGVVGADVEQQLGPIGDDVRLRSGVRRTDRDDGELTRFSLPGHDGLQAQNDRGREDHGVDGQVRHRPVGAATEDRDLHRIPGRHHWSGSGEDLAGRQRHDVLGQGHIGGRNLVRQPVIDHRLRPGRVLLCRLEERDIRA